ncbi:MAG: ATP-binding cassette domain-containing protein [Paludibacteraceae bacterium]|nr:ATP-binding cassette domain-containing protein [Paludibacteraceae bacterium]
MTSIEFENISKQYRLGLVSTRTLSHDLNRWWQTAVLRREDPYLKIGDTNDRSTHGTSDYVWALRDISFKVEQGDVVGIIGKNGAGKSTLLKLLSKVTSPTTGTIRARGRIASLLEVGTGFHGEMTGRENIYLNGAIMGMTKQEIDRKLDEIVDFSGCERYIDTPVKRYSSGMTVRLGFAVAAHLDPEILVVDEVLAVGDAEFQKKAIGKMQDISHGEGRTVLFVSHNMNSIQQLCRTGVVLKNGHLDFWDTASNAVDYYIGRYHQNDTAMYYEDLNSAPGNDKIRIRSMEVSDSNGGHITIDSEIDVKLQFYNYVANSMIDCTFELRTADDIVVFHRWLNFSPNHDSIVGEQQISFSIPAHLLNAGKYYFKIHFGENEAHLLWGELIYNFEVEFTKEVVGNLILGQKPGIVRPELKMKHEML